MKPIHGLYVGGKRDSGVQTSLHVLARDLPLCALPLPCRQHNSAVKHLDVEPFPPPMKQLDAWPGLAKTDSGNWQNHSAVKQDDGTIVDVDRGRVYPSEEEWAKDTVKDPTQVTMKEQVD